jgi:flagellar biosynthesis protein FlhA
MPNRELAIHYAAPGPGTKQADARLEGPPVIAGVPTREPAFGIAAIWIAPEAAANARSHSYTVVDPLSVLGTHLAELIRRHASELLSRQDTKAILDRVAEANPRVIEDLVPKMLPMSTVQKVLQNLLRERVSIRDACTILEALGEAATMTKNPVLLTEYARQAIRRLLVKPYLNAAGQLPAFFVDPQMEQVIEGLREILDSVTRAARSGDSPAAAITARYFLRQASEGQLPNLSILSHNEIPAGVRVVSHGVIQ